MNDIFSKKQEEAIKFFQENLGKLLADPLYRHKHVVIYDNEVRGFFDTFQAAFADAVAKYPRTDFIIQQIISDDETVGFLYSAVA